MEKRIKVDLHTHSGASFDSWITPEQYIRRTVKLGFGAMAVTDHGTIRGALAIRDLDPPFQVIVGEEVSTSKGELIGLFLEEHIPEKLSPEETCNRIHDQGGLVLVPHPFGRMALDRMKKELLPNLANSLDIVETINARNTFNVDDKKAEDFAERHGLAQSAGSDSHMVWDMGRAYQHVREFDGPADFLLALREANHTLEKRTFFGLSTVAAIYGIFHTSKRRP